MSGTLGKEKCSILKDIGNELYLYSQGCNKMRFWKKIS